MRTKCAYTGRVIHNPLISSDIFSIFTISCFPCVKLSVFTHVSGLWIGEQLGQVLLNQGVI